MQLSFRTLATLTTALCFVLALIWGLIPEFMLSIWGVAYDNTAGLMARRGAMLFVTLGVMFFMARHAPPSIARTAMSSGVVIGLFGLAVLGFSEWLNGRAGPGILLAVVVEITLGAAFLQTRRDCVELTQSVD